MNPMLYTHYNNVPTVELDALVEQLAARARELYRAYKAARDNGASVKRAFKAWKRVEWETHVAFCALYVRSDYPHPRTFA